MKTGSTVIVFISLVFFGALHCQDQPATSSEAETDAMDDTDSLENGTDLGVDADTDADADSDTAADIDIETDFTPRTNAETLTLETADFEQTDDENGLVVIEAEDYTTLIEATDGSAWQEVTRPENYSGTGAMQATPPEYVAHKDLWYARKYAPILVYTVNFVKAEPVYVWARASHIDGYDDSVWYGKNGIIEGTSPLTFWETEHGYINVWHYIRFLMEGALAILDVPEAGNYTFELYMREPSFIVDKIVLTTNPDFDPNTL